MKPYLHYPSIVCRRFAHVDHLVGNSKLWNEVYSIFSSLKKEHKLSVSAIDVLNEVYLQSMRALLVKHADDEDLWEGYVFRSRSLKSDSSATQLCLSLVYAALCLMRIPIEQAVEHLQILRERHLMDEHGKPSRFFHSVFVILWQKERKRSLPWYLGFLRAPDWDHVFNLASFDVPAPLPMQAHRVCAEMTAEDWMLATGCFDGEYVREVVFRWPTKDERLQVLDSIETACYSLKDKECPPGMPPADEAGKQQAVSEDFDLIRTEIEAAVEMEAETRLLSALIDRAVELFSKAGLVALLACLTTMRHSECVKEHVERVDRAIKKPDDQAPRTQYNYYAGANHISGSQFKGVSIGAVPDNLTLPQE